MVATIEAKNVCIAEDFAEEIGLSYGPVRQSSGTQRSQPFGFHGAVFRRLQRVPDVITLPGEDAPRSRSAHSQRAVYRPGRLERRLPEPEQLHAYFPQVLR